MTTIYIMDTTVPIPENITHTFEDVLEKDVSELNISYTLPVLDWVQNEFKKIFAMVKVQNKFEFQNFFITFFESILWGTPEAFFNSDKKLLAINVRTYTGSESNFQRYIIHEVTHAITSAHSLVGVALAEGIANYMEGLFCKANDIPDSGEEQDEGYIFGQRLLKTILQNIYNNDLEMFFSKIKRGNEQSFINDINEYLKSKNIPYNASELLRLTSILFYAKNLPNSPFEEYIKNDEMEMLHNEILGIISNENNSDNLIIYNYLSAIKYITDLCNVLKDKLSNYETFSTTLDRELGLAIKQNGSSLLLDKQKVVNIIKSVFQIIKINEDDFGEYINALDSKKL